MGPKTLLYAAATAAVAVASVSAKGSDSPSNGGASPSSIDNPDLWDLADNHAKAGNADEVFYGSTDLYGNPVFLDTFDAAAPFHGDAPTQCRDNATNLSLQNLREHPRLIAPGYQWDCLAQRIGKDGYLTVMNESVFTNASAWYGMPPTNYSIDGGYSGSGIRTSFLPPCCTQQGADNDPYYSRRLARGAAPCACLGVRLPCYGR